MSKDAYIEDQTLKSSIANENSLGPITSSSTLDSLKLLSHFYKHDPQHSDAIKKIVDAESEYILHGMKALANSNYLQARFGKGFNSALMLAGVLKQRASERVANQILDEYTPNRRKMLNFARSFTDIPEQEVGADPQAQAEDAEDL